MWAKPVARAICYLRRAEEQAERARTNERRAELVLRASVTNAEKVGCQRERESCGGVGGCAPLWRAHTTRNTRLTRRRLRSTGDTHTAHAPHSAPPLDHHPHHRVGADCTGRAAGIIPLARPFASPLLHSTRLDSCEPLSPSQLSHRGSGGGVCKIAPAAAAALPL